MSAKQRSSALTVLRSKKLVTETLDKRRASVLQLEEILAKIDQAHDNLAMVRVMEASASVLRNLNRDIGGMERVEGITEGLRVEMDKVEDVTAVIGEVGDAVIEGEVDAELEELERMEREKKEKEEAEDRRKEAEMRKKEDEMRAEETRRRLAELDDAENKRQEAEREIESRQTREDQKVEENTKKMGRMSLEEDYPIVHSQNNDDQPRKEEAQVLAS